MPAGDTGYIVSPWAVILGAAALLLVTLLRSRFRLLAVPVALLMVFSFGRAWQPDVLILENGRQVAVSGEVVALRLLRPSAEKFSTGIWKRAFWPGLIDAEHSEQGDNGFICDQFGCSASAKGVTVVHVINTAMLAEDCRFADVLVIPYNMRNACYDMPARDRPVVIDRNALEKYGAHALEIAQANTAKDNSIGARASKAERSRLVITTSYATSPRPWTRHRFASDQR